MNKVCRVCNVSLPITSFYNGHAKCKKCYINLVRDRRNGTIEWSTTRRIKIDGGLKECRLCKQLLPLDNYYPKNAKCKYCLRMRTSFNHRIRISTEVGKNRYKYVASVWKQANADRVKAIRYRNKAKRKLVQGSFTNTEWFDLKHKYGNICLRCGALESEAKLTVDHVVPITKGGSGYITNIQPLCGSCNSIKGNKYIDYRE